MTLHYPRQFIPDPAYKYLGIVQAALAIFPEVDRGFARGQDAT